MIRHCKADVEQIIGRIVKILRKNHGGFSLASKSHILAFLMDEGAMGRVARLRDIPLVVNALELAIDRGLVLQSPDQMAIGLPPGDPPLIHYGSLLNMTESITSDFSMPVFRNLPTWAMKELAHY